MWIFKEMVVTVFSCLGKLSYISHFFPSHGILAYKHQHLDESEKALFWFYGV